MTRGWVRAGFALFGAGLALITADRANPPDMTRANTLSPEVVASDGTLLRAFLSPDGAWRIHTRPRDVAPRYLLLLKAYEDRRFDAHPGVDVMALGRAAAQWLGAGHVVSGGSTLTMQVARLLEPGLLQHRGVLTKGVQAIRALQLEERYSKDEILSLYLTLAPMGGNLEGVRAASLSYFGKEPAALDLAQSALLVALPQSPVKARPDRHAQAARTARNHVLDRMVAEGVVTAGDAVAAKREGVPFARQPMPLIAPHLAQRLVLNRKEPRIATTIRADIQQAAERMAAQERGYFDDGADLAIVVVENKTRNLVAYVGGTQYWGRGGQVDLAARSRSPGSALKPFIYGLAFDNLALHPLTRMTDEATSFGDYAPQDFEGSFVGTVTARDALRMSLNIPAVALLDRVGPLTFTLTLQNAGARLAFPPGGAAPTLPVALGGWASALATSPCCMPASPRAGRRGRCASSRAQPTRRRIVCSGPWPPGTCATFWMASRCPMAGRWGKGCCVPARWASRPAPLTVSAMPGRWASPTIIPWRCGWAAPTARRAPAIWGAKPVRRSC